MNLINNGIYLNRKMKKNFLITILSITFLYYSFSMAIHAEATETIPFNYYISIPYAYKDYENMALDISGTTNKLIIYAKHSRGNQTLGFEYIPKDDAYIIFSGENKQKLLRASSDKSGSHVNLFEFTDMAVNSLANLPEESLWQIEKTSTTDFYRITNKKNGLALTDVGTDDSAPVQLQGKTTNNNQLFKITSFNRLFYLKPSLKQENTLDISGGVGENPIITYTKGTTPQENQQWYAVYLPKWGTYLIGNYKDRSLLLHYTANKDPLKAKRFNLDVNNIGLNQQFLFIPVPKETQAYFIQPVNQLNIYLSSEGPYVNGSSTTFRGSKTASVTTDKTQQWILDFFGNVTAPVLSNLKIVDAKKIDPTSKLPLIYPGETLAITGAIASNFFKGYDLYARMNLNISEIVKSDLSITDGKSPFSYTFSEDQTAQLPNGLNSMEINGRADKYFPSNGLAANFMVDYAIPTLTADSTLNYTVGDNPLPVIKGSFTDKKANTLEITAKINQSTIEIPILKQSGTQNTNSIAWQLDLNSLTPEQKSSLTVGENTITFTLKNDWKVYNTATTVTKLNILGTGKILYKNDAGKEIKEQTPLKQTDIAKPDYLVDIPATIDDYKLVSASGDGVLLPETSQIKGTFATKAVESIANYEQYRFYLSYDGNGFSAGSLPEKQVFEVGKQQPAIPSPGDLTKKGYHFKEWNTKADGTGQTYHPGDLYQTSKKNKTLYAIWRPAKVTMSVNFLYSGTDKPIYQDIRTGTEPAAPVKYEVFADSDLASSISSQAIPLDRFGYSIANNGAYTVQLDGKTIDTTTVPQSDFSISYSYNGMFNISESSTIDFGSQTIKNTGTIRHNPINNPVINILNTEAISQWTLYIKQDQPLQNSDTLFKGALFYKKKDAEIELTTSNQQFIGAHNSDPYTSVNLGSNENTASELYMKEYFGNKVGQYEGILWWSLVNGP
ncbi:InlB B-repeat-containing protein [Enterococcus quebecensis]|uniref:Ricin B lectin domain-containing protein n=1 Tax=Enterococcus quebecensis TaxID=903983 RepID=A0A1E5GTC2_9ENTE|nr:RICIN domain-containing protein [Enterococcus quebecensis]OEG15530.1 hypothetical protein BCR23_08665 [Enterococcus quebecensis]